MHRLMPRLCLLMAAGLITLLGCGPAPAATNGSATSPAGTVTTIEFYYPVSVGGPIQELVNSYITTFNTQNPDVKVTAVFSGNYQESLTKIQTTIDSQGKPPALAVLLSSDVYSLVDADQIVPFDPYLAQAGTGYLSDFFPAFLLNSQTPDGHTWGIPFQRSTPVLYYNKDMFKAAGLNPERAPTSWAELVAMGKQLTVPNSRWGVLIPSSGSPYWVFQALVLGNNSNLLQAPANKVDFNTPQSVEALQFLRDLSATHKIMPAGTIDWAATPDAFVAGKAAMIYHTSGSLANILSKAAFDVGVAFLPGKQGFGTPTGGGNLYLFKNASAAEQQAAWRLVQFLTAPEQAAQWSKATGYIATRRSAYETPVLKQYLAEHPQAAVARDQLQYAGKELATHQSRDIQKIMNEAIQAVLTGGAQPQAALDTAQAKATAALAAFKD